MTELQLRQKVVETIVAWKGSKRGSAGHIDILNLYNNYKPLARGYKLVVKDNWCAATVSAVWIKLDIAKYIFTECSCSRLIELAKKNNIWVEQDNYIPKIGDCILFDWDDKSDYIKTDNTGAPEHIGIVTYINGNRFVVTEGNKGDASVVGDRPMSVNGRYIRGFITPDYAKIALSLIPAIPIDDGKDESNMKRYNTLAEIKTTIPYAYELIKELCDRKVILGGGKKDADGYPADMDLSLDMIRTLIFANRM